MKLAAQIQILNKAVCVSLDAKAQAKGMNPSVLTPPVMSKELSRLGSLNLA